MSKIIRGYGDLSTSDNNEILSLLDWGDRAQISAFPFVAAKTINDALKAAAAGQYPKISDWLTRKGYTYNPTYTPTAGATASTATGQWSDGTQISPISPRGTPVTRFTIKIGDDYYGLAKKGDDTTWDYLWDTSKNKWIYVEEDPTTFAISAPAEIDYTGKHYNKTFGRWDADTTTATGIDALLGGAGTTTTPIEDQQIKESQASIDNQRATLQRQYDELNSGNLSDAQTLALNQWYQNAQVSIQKDQNALDLYKTQMTAWQTAGSQQLENQKYMSELAQSPLDSVAYAYRQYGANVPSYWKSSFQPLTDPYAGLTNPSAPTWGNIPTSPDLSQIQGTNYAPTPIPTPSPASTWTQNSTGYNNQPPTNTPATIGTANEWATPSRTYLYNGQYYPSNWTPPPAQTTSLPSYATNTPATNGMVYFNGKYYPDMQTAIASQGGA